MPMLYWLADLCDSLTRTREGRWLVAAIAVILYLLIFILFTFITLIDMTGVTPLMIIFMIVGSGMFALMIGTMFALVDCIFGAILALKQYLLGPGRAKRVA